MQAQIHALIQRKTGDATPVSYTKPVGGGSINRCFEVGTGQGRYFLKVNKAQRYPGMFEAEVRGLELLRTNSSFHVPKPIGTNVEGDEQWLLMECVLSGSRSVDFWPDFGHKLARMHQQSSARFGLDHDNYIGSLPQRNMQADSWPSFFVAERLEPQIKRASDQQWFDVQDRRNFERLYMRLGEFFPEEPPSLLHGDLWSGNYMVGPKGEPVVMDPAVYYGHRFMDLGMTLLFGGFGSEMYQSYSATHELPANWREGAEVANLYPLLVHVNLFGGSYVSQVRGILMRFGQ